MALILACYSLGHKRSQISYYSNNSLQEVFMLGQRWKRFPYKKKEERKKLGFWMYLPSTQSIAPFVRRSCYHKYDSNS